MSPKAFFLTVLGLFASIDLLVTVRMFVLLRTVPGRRIWRVVMVLWGMAVVGFCVLIMFANPMISGARDPLPRWLVAAAFIWHFLVLPVLVVGLFFDAVVRAVRGGIRWVKPAVEKKAGAEVLAEPVTNFSRRRFLSSAAILAAPVATAGMAGAGLWQLGRFRVRTYELAIAGWPRELDGYSMTVIADVHVGDFSTPEMLENIVKESNRLKSDLVLLPGDLINMSHSDLPQALDMVQRLESRDGVYMIEGNHDVIQGADLFDYKVRRRGVNLLVDEAVTIRTRGSQFQLLGTRWCDEWFRRGSVAYTAGLRESGIFPIMMAHHPDSWDEAAQLGIPLMISGHTHGGQIMLTKNIGGGPLRFKYWSGRYDKPGSTLIVSNGVGNWFPLRVGAPAEILRINLHPGNSTDSPPLV